MCAKVGIRVCGVWISAFAGMTGEQFGSIRILPHGCFVIKPPMQAHVLLSPAKSNVGVLAKIGWSQELQQRIIDFLAGSFLLQVRQASFVGAGGYRVITACAEQHDILTEVAHAETAHIGNPP